MVSYVDVCLFSQNLATTQRLSRDEARDMTMLAIEEERTAFAFGGRVPEPFVPFYDGQYHIDFWLSQVEIFFVNSYVPEKYKCDNVINYFSEDVWQAYDAMQWSRIHRGEEIINDWPTLKALLRCVFLPLMEQLHTTVRLNHLPSPPPKKKKIISTTTTDKPAATVNSELLRKLESLSLALCSNNEVVKSLKEKMARLNRQTKDLVDQLSTKLIPNNGDALNYRKQIYDNHETDVFLKRRMDALATQAGKQANSLYRDNY